ncbi:MAG: DUF4418 family protein [Spirochaetales bacterium]|jgi:hypothetical protein|nr:DUF4418 family protein [Spirochaetales bacterium]
MKSRIASGLTILILGLLISLGPQFLFKPCGPVLAHDGAAASWMKCHWSVRAEIGVGALAAALGIGLLAFRSRDTRLGLWAGVFLSGVLALLIPHVLIGGCAMATMPCQALTFPALTLLGILVALFSGGNLFFHFRRVRG